MTEEETTTEPAGTEGDEQAQLPPVDFTSLISEFAMAASAYLGQLQASETDEVLVNLGMGRRMIDTIELLKEKTQGNLTAAESDFLEGALYNLRMAYVRASQKPASAPEAEASEEDTPDKVLDAEVVEGS